MALVPFGSRPTEHPLGVAVGRDAQRVVAVGQRSRERRLQMQVANDVASANELPSREARPRAAVVTAPRRASEEVLTDCRAYAVRALASALEPRWRRLDLQAWRPALRR